MLVHFFYVMSGFDEKNLNSKTHLEKSLENKKEKLFSLAADGWGPPVRTTSFFQPSLPNPLSQQQPPRPKPRSHVLQLPPRLGLQVGEPLAHPSTTPPPFSLLLARAPLVSAQRTVAGKFFVDRA